MKSLTKNIWRSSISPRVINTPVQYLHSTGLTVWLRNVGHDGEVQPARLDEFDQWCLRHILRVPFTAHVTNQEVRRRSTQPPVIQTVMLRRLRFFGHVIRSDPDEDHTRALNAGINDPPKEWRRPRGRPRQTWLYAPSRTTSNIRTWDCGRRGTELMTVICGVISWKRRRSGRGMLHDDDDDELLRNITFSNTDGHLSTICFLICQFVCLLSL